MELIDLIIEIERFCSRNNFDKDYSVEQLIDYMNELDVED
jgi:hypothetical protein